MPILLTIINNKWRPACKTFDKDPKRCMHSKDIIMIIIILYATNEMTSVMEGF